MDNSKEQTNPGSSFLPVFLIGLLIMFGFQYFFQDEEPVENVPQVIEDPGRAYNNFIFPRTERGNQRVIDTGTHIAVLDTRGGRIDRLYIKSHGDLDLPMQVIQKTGDQLAIDNKALEITRYNGMDFQFHLYFDGRYAEELGQPPMNEAAFREIGYEEDEQNGVYEVRYRLDNLRYKNEVLDLTKVYRFFRGENYFHQVTILHNSSREDMDLKFVEGGKELWGDLYFKTFGDLGPVTDKKDSYTLSGYGRFFFWNDELINRSNYHKGGSGGAGCGFPFGCSSHDRGDRYSKYIEIQDSLKLMGSTSRYFFAYSEFLYPENVSLQIPDGFIYRNDEDATGREAYTSMFNAFKLEGNEGTPIDIGGIDAIFDAQGNPVPPEEGTAVRIRELQKERRDALILDNRVFVGIRSPAAHDFNRADLMLAEFGTENPNPKASDVIFTSRFHAFFSVIQRGVVWLMHLLYSEIGNYGWVIIIIAVGFKLLTFPLNQMQAKSMKRMSKLKPEIDRLNKTYADNPQEKNKKMMELYKQHGVNPMKGCLPIFIQMPVFIALYSAFSGSIELWNSPFIWWMKDLSSPDTIMTLPFIDVGLNILPLVMAASQILQQRFTTMVTDPNQKMIMYMMPVMMLFFFWSMPSGVTLYWTVQNFISIIWQVANNRLVSDDDDPATAKA